LALLLSLAGYGAHAEDSLHIITVDQTERSGSLAKFLDEPSKAMDATPLIWQFFAAHPKP
jgi:hypothetical protein